jgi:hypothetical protein
MTDWTDREDRIIASKLDYPDLTWAELQTALRSIGCRRTAKGIEHRLAHLRRQRDAVERSEWLRCPVLTGKRRTA